MPPPFLLRSAALLLTAGLCLAATACRSSSASRGADAGVHAQPVANGQKSPSTWQWPWRRKGPVEARPVAEGPDLPQMAPVTPGTPGDWNLNPGPGQPHPPGQGLITPDGTIMMGPYGQYKLPPGMTPEQAQAAIEQQLRAYANQHGMQLQPAGPDLPPVQMTPSVSRRLWSSDPANGDAASAGGQPYTTPPADAGSAWGTYSEPRWGEPQPQPQSQGWGTGAAYRQAPVSQPAQTRPAQSAPPQQTSKGWRPGYWIGRMTGGN